MKKKKISIGKETLAYLDEGKGPVVLLIHGNMSSSIHFSPLIQRICDKFRCIAPDIRGFGDSTYNQEFDSLTELADDMALFLDKLEIHSAYVLGWSTGGGIAFQFAANHSNKVKGLFITEGVGLKGYPIYVKGENYKSIVGKAYETKQLMAKDPLQVAPPLAMMENNDVVAMTALWDMTIYSVNKPSKEDNDIWIAETVKQRNLVDIDWSLANFNMSDEYTAYSKGDGSIHKIKCPVALTLAQNDLVVPDYMVMDNYNALGDKATLLPYEKCGHSPLVDCPDQLAQDVEKFFATIK